MRGLPGTLVNLGQQKYAEASPLLLAAYDGLRQGPPAPRPSPLDRDRLPDTLHRLVELYTATNKPDQAAKWRAELDSVRAEQAK